MRPIALSPWRPILAGTLFALFASCGRYPYNFATLPLEKKVEVDVDHFNHFGRPNLWAESWISWHGWAAADLMAEFLERRRVGLPDYEAIKIIDLVQTRGCSLSGTPAERALGHFLAHEPKDSVESLFARDTLETIRRNFKFRNGPDTLTGGPCDKKR